MGSFSERIVILIRELVSYRITPPLRQPPPTKLSLKVVQNYKNLQDYSTLSAFIYLIHYNPFWQKNQKRKNKKITQKSKLQIINQTRSVQEVICAFGSFPFLVLNIIHIHIHSHIHSPQLQYSIYDIRYIFTILYSHLYIVQKYNSKICLSQIQIPMTVPKKNPTNR